MLQTAKNTVCSKGKHFNRSRSISLFSLFFDRLPIPDTNTVTDSFHGIELGIPLLFLFSSRSDRLGPYCFLTMGLSSLLISGLGWFLWLCECLLPVFGVGVSCLPPLLPPRDMHSLPVSFLVGLQSLHRPATHFHLSWFRLPIFLFVVFSALGSRT